MDYDEQHGHSLGTHMRRVGLLQGLSAIFGAALYASGVHC